MSRLLSHVSPGWRRRGALRGRALDVRVAGARLRAALHDLAVFADATLANAHDAQDKGSYPLRTYIPQMFMIVRSQ